MTEENCCWCGDSHPGEMRSSGTSFCIQPEVYAKAATGISGFTVETHRKA